MSLGPLSKTKCIHIFGILLDVGLESCEQHDISANETQYCIILSIDIPRLAGHHRGHAVTFPQHTTYTHTHIQAHAHVHAYAHAHIHIHAQTCTRTHTHTRKHSQRINQGSLDFIGGMPLRSQSTHTHTHTHTQAHTQAHAHVHAHVHAHIHTHTHTRTYIHTRIHTHTHIHNLYTEDRWSS